MPEDLYAEIARLRREGRNAALATIIDVRGSIPSHEAAKLLIREDGSLLGTIGGGCIEAEVWQEARALLAAGAPAARRRVFHLNHDAGDDSGLICGGTLEVFIELILAAPRLYLFGGGHVGRAIAAAATAAGFSLVVADDREAFASAERFPQAEARWAGEWDDILPQIQLGPNAYVAIVTRGHKGDLRVLEWALATPARYLGMIGSRRKIIATYQELFRRGSSAAALARVRAPIGLEIGAVTPEEIAVAVTAEMIAVRRGAPLPPPPRAVLDALGRAAAIADPGKAAPEKDGAPAGALP